ncbi:MAG: gamma-glutamylcyclotransferase [Chitinophagaceae bacterium]|nr:gamma-glutamylcyclotransferase [Chitinophagaceae bacterium]
MLIFAYGSNMNINRLAQRVPSATKVTNVFLPGYKLVCNKVSKDGSVKANILNSDIPGDIVWGVLFKIDSKEKSLLDKAEGLGKGYNEDCLTFYDESNSQYVAQVYIADTNSINNNLVPYDWYKEFIVTGAIQNQLPADYILLLQSIICISDPDEERRIKQYSILSGK